MRTIVFCWLRHPCGTLKRFVVSSMHLKTAGMERMWSIWATTSCFGLKATNSNRAYSQRKFRNLTLDYTDSCRQVLQHRCLTADMFLQHRCGMLGTLAGRNCVGRRGGFEEGPKRCFSRGTCRSSYASAQLFRGRRSTFEASTLKSLKRIVILRSCVWSTCHFWGKARKNASFLVFKASCLKEVSQKCFVFEFKASFLKEVSQKSFDFEQRSFIFEGSLAEKPRFELSSCFSWISWISKPIEFQIERLANQLNFKANDSQTNWISNQMNQIWIHLNLKSNESNLNSSESHITWTSSHLLESQITWTLESQINDRQWNHFPFKSVEPRTAWTSNQLTLKAVNFQIAWTSNQMKLKTVESEIIRTWNDLQIRSLESQVIYLNLKLFESQISHWQSNHLNLESIDNQTSRISNHLTTKSFESQNNWIANHLNLNSIDFQILKSKQLNLKWTVNKKLESQINGISNLLNLQTKWNAKYIIESEINWLSNRTNSIPDLLLIGSLSLETSATASCGRYVIIEYIQSLYIHAETAISQ